MKVRQIIYLDFWYDESGFGHTETFEDSIIDVKNIPKEFDWNWWKKYECEKICDNIRIRVIYFNEDCTIQWGWWSIWESDIE